MKDAELNGAIHDAFLERACHQLGYNDSTFKVLIAPGREIRVKLLLRKAKHRQRPQRVIDESAGPSEK